MGWSHPTRWVKACCAGRKRHLAWPGDTTSDVGTGVFEWRMLNTPRLWYKCSAGWWFQTWLDDVPFHFCGIYIILPIDLTHIFQRGRYTTNQSWFMMLNICWIMLFMVHHGSNQVESRGDIITANHRVPSMIELSLTRFYRNDGAFLLIK